jgi:hypothetical protein
MSAELGTTPSFLSALETGSKYVDARCVVQITEFFLHRGLHLDTLGELATKANAFIPPSGLTHQQTELLRRLAHTQRSQEQLNKFAGLLARINAF